jgi:hypothetical protein
MSISSILLLLYPYYASCTSYGMKPGHLTRIVLPRRRGDQESLGKTYGADLSSRTTSSYGQDRSVPIPRRFEPLRQAFYLPEQAFYLPEY